jgi:hypothetical protein
MHAKLHCFQLPGATAPPSSPGPICQNGMTGGATRHPDLCTKQPCSGRGLTDSQSQAPDRSKKWGVLTPIPDTKRD